MSNRSSCPRGYGSFPWAGGKRRGTVKILRPGVNATAAAGPGGPVFFRAQTAFGCTLAARDPHPPRPLVAPEPRLPRRAAGAVAAGRPQFRRRRNPRRGRHRGGRSGHRRRRGRGRGAGGGRRAPRGATAPGRGKRGGAGRCEVQVPAAAAARLADRTEVPQAQLAPLLGSGAVALRFAGAPALQSEGPVYLALRNLVREAEALVRAWEAGEPAFQLRFASIELTCDLTRDEVRAPGWRAPAAVAPAALALALAGPARAYAEKAQKLAGRPVESDDPLRDLPPTAARLARHCAELASGELR